MLPQVQVLSNWLEAENLFWKKTNCRQCQLIKIQVKWHQYADIFKKNLQHSGIIVEKSISEKSENKKSLKIIHVILSESHERLTRLW